MECNSCEHTICLTSSEAFSAVYIVYYKEFMTTPRHNTEQIMKSFKSSAEFLWIQHGGGHRIGLLYTESKLLNISTTVWKQKSSALFPLSGEPPTTTYIWISPWKASWVAVSRNFICHHVLKIHIYSLQWRIIVVHGTPQRTNAYEKRRKQRALKKRSPTT